MDEEIKLNDETLEALRCPTCNHYYQWSQPLEEGTLGLLMCRRGHLFIVVVEEGDAQD